MPQVWVREDALTAAVHQFFASRVLGPDRRAFLDAQLGDRSHNKAETASRQAQLTKHIGDLRRRQAKLLDQLEDDTDDDLSPEDARAFRKSIRDRFAKLGNDIRAAEAERDARQPFADASPECRRQAAATRRGRWRSVSFGIGSFGISGCVVMSPVVPRGDDMRRSESET